MNALVLDAAQIDSFRCRIYDFYSGHGRDFAWRHTRDPYAVLVSEMMLQQTQTSRVVPKYDAWMARFPDVWSLAQAPLADVLAAWNGLGYNRRAVFLQKARFSALPALSKKRFGTDFKLNLKIVPA